DEERPEQSRGLQWLGDAVAGNQTLPDRREAPHVVLIARPACGDVERPRDRHAGSQEDPEGPREARLDPEPDETADDWHAKDDPLADPPDDPRIADKGERDDGADDDGHGLDAVRRAERADRDHDLRRQRKLGAEIREE